MSRGPIILALLTVLAAFPATSVARPIAPDLTVTSGGRDQADTQSFALPYIQCVPYARQVSGIQLYGDAHTWWGQAAGRYARGTRPKAGAVMAFRPHGAMQLGHVAAISRVIDARTVLLRHANWSPIDGRRGQLEDNVRAVDVSEANDWSEVRVWYAPLGGLGTTHWPVEGFIYNQKAPQTQRLNERLTVLASADVQRAEARPAKTAYSSRIGPDFLKGIAPEAGQTAPRSRSAPREVTAAAPQAGLRHDPIGRIIASRLR
jgi:surface antigen